MSRFFVAVFGLVFAGLTATAGYMTLTDVGVLEPGAKQIRAGGVNRGGGAYVASRGIRRGK